MNSAQKRLVELKLKIPLNMPLEHNFIQDCIKAWDGYDEMGYSYPAWQLRGLEKKYGTEVSIINKKYNHDNQKL